MTNVKAMTLPQLAAVVDRMPPRDLSHTWLPFERAARDEYDERMWTLQKQERAA